MYGYRTSISSSVGGDDRVLSQSTCTHPVINGLNWIIKKKGGKEERRAKSHCKLTSTHFLALFVYYDTTMNRGGRCLLSL